LDKKTREIVGVSNDEQPSLKTLRESADLTQPELSQKLGVGIRIIGDWENGKKTPRLDNAIALARELGVSLKTGSESDAPWSGRYSR